MTANAEDSSLWDRIKSGIARLRVDDLSDHSTHAQNLYDTIDDWDSCNLLGRAYTLYHPLEPRALIWVFMIAVPIVIALLVTFIDQTLVWLFYLKHTYIARGMADWASDSGGKLMLVACAWGLLTVALLALSWFWSRKTALGTAGRGMPRVLANLNGVYMPHWSHFRILGSKLISVIITVLSGVPYDYVGNICEIGAMVGSCSLSRHPLWMKLCPMSRYFRNPRDSRLLVALGIAAAATCAFHSPIGGLALLIELSAVKFTVKFVYRVFMACNIAGFIIQIIYTHIYGWELRSGTGEWFMRPLSQIVQIHENLLTVLPAVFLGVLGGLFQGVFAIMSNFILNRPELKSIQVLLFVSFMYGLVVYILCGVYGISGSCLPYTPSAQSDFAKFGTDPFPHSAMFCNQKPPSSSSSSSPSPSSNFTTTTTSLFSTTFTPPGGNNFTTTAVPQGPTEYVNGFAALTLGFDSSILRMMFRRSVPDFWTAAELAPVVVLFCIMLPFLTVLSIVDGDVLMPTGLLGGCVGQLVYLAVRSWGVDKTWIDGGLFSLLGAVSFIGGMNRLTFSLTFLFVDYAGDVRHVLFIMMAISVARAVADRVASVRIDYIVMKYQGYAILDFALNIEKYDSITLHDFQQRDLKVIPPTATVGQIIRLLKTSFHNAFPVIEPHSQRFLGLVYRRTLQLIVWGFSENLPPHLRHPWDWPGLVPEGAAPHMVAVHNFLAAGATESSAIHSIRMAKLEMHQQRQQYESFWGNQQNSTASAAAAAAAASSQNNNQNSSSPSSPPFGSSAGASPAGAAGGGAATTGSPVLSGAGSVSSANNSRSNLAAAAASGAGGGAASSSSPNLHENQPVFLDDYDQYDVHAAAAEYHRLRDLDDFLHVTFAEDQATLFHFAQSIRPERSLGHVAFVEETDGYSSVIKRTHINLIRYTDRAAFTVRAAMCVSRLYNMFTVLGLRHATIVDYMNRPTGVITRRDLMTYKIIEKKKRQGASAFSGFTQHDGSSSPVQSELSVQAGDPRDEMVDDDDDGGGGGAPRARRSTQEPRQGQQQKHQRQQQQDVAITRFFDDDNARANLIQVSSPTRVLATRGGTGHDGAQQQATRGGGGDQNNDDDTESRTPSVLSVADSSATADSVAAAAADDAFHGRVLYQVNMMRPPMLLPRRWSGGNSNSNNNNDSAAAGVAGGGAAAAGRGERTNNNNQTNNNNNRPSARAAADTDASGGGASAGGGVVSFVSDGAESQASYSTVMSDPDAPDAGVEVVASDPPPAANSQ